MKKTHIIECGICSKKMKRSAMWRHKKHYHKGEGIKSQAEKQNKEIEDQISPIKLFSIIADEVHLRCAEFKGGYLILNGDYLTWFPNLNEAIQAHQINESNQQRQEIKGEN